MKNNHSPFTIHHSLITILNSLSEYGREKRREVYFVGGCLRDLLLDRNPKDWDFIVEGDGIPFARGFAERIGGKFFTLDRKTDEARIVLMEEKHLLFDFIGLKGNPLENELERRDFTINAFAHPLDETISNPCFKQGQFPISKIIDPFNGKKDLKEKKIRLVRTDGFEKDPLRILRAFRFSSILSYTISFETLEKIKEEKGLLRGISPERIREEILALLRSPHSFPIMKEMAETGVLTEIFPELERMKGVPQGKADGGDLWDHSFLTYEKVEAILRGEEEITKESGELQEIQNYLNSSSSKIPLLKLAALFHDIGKPETLIEDANGEIHFYGHDRMGAEMVERMGRENLKMSRKENETLKISVLHHMWPHLLSQEKRVTPRAIRRFLREGGKESIGILLLAYGDGLASLGDSRYLSNLNNLIQMTLQEVLEQRKTPFRRIVSGEDLKRVLGMEPGPQMGEILKKIEEEQLEGIIETRDEALALAREMVKSLNG